VKAVLATANPDKSREIVDALADLDLDLELVPRPNDVPPVEEDGETLEDNARLKAVALCAATGLPAIADDTGLEVDALGGAPGVATARYAGDTATYTENLAKLLRELDGTSPGNRGARFTTVAITRFPDGVELSGRGTVSGLIALEPRGAEGFGYDPVFVPDEGDGRTFAEMTLAEKRHLSHRGRAFRELGARLRARLEA
jgi:XTP/dITP diphosphohydrolase